MSGGLQGGSEPPAFQRAEKQRQRESEKEGKLRESSQLNLGNDSSQVVYKLHIFSVITRFSLQVAYYVQDTRFLSLASGGFKSIISQFIQTHLKPVKLVSLSCPCVNCQ